MPADLIKREGCQRLSLRQEWDVYGPK